MESRSFTQNAFHPDGSTLDFYQLFDDRQTDA
jgi:hypothetical protein